MAPTPHSSGSFLSKVAGAVTLGWSDSPGGRAWLRRRLSLSARRALRLRSRPFSADGLRSVLVVAPHPDDETLGSGGAVALLARAGVPTHIAFVTDGSASHPLHPVFTPAQIAGIRENEARAATAALGIDWSRVEFLGAPDGGLADLGAAGAAEVAARIARLLTRLNPDAILLPCRGDGSSDHNAAFQLVEKALGETGQRPRMLEFPIWAWRNPLLLLKPLVTSRTVWRVALGELRDAKLAALAAYVSQTLPIPPDKEPLLSPEFKSEFTSTEEFYFEQ
jgi:LmbE family N-acetylglucosaminyl deacetylase